MLKLSSLTHRLRTISNRAVGRLRRQYRRLQKRLGQVGQRWAKWWRRNDRRWYPWWRVANGLVALLLVVSIVWPVWTAIYNSNRYRLSDQALALVGQADPKLQKQLTYDSATNTYQFNKAAVPNDKDGNPLSAMQAQVGAANGQGSDKSLYALDVPTDFTKGVTYHDVNSGLSFSLVPQFSALAGKTASNHLVFPLANNQQAVYTLKNNGLKEDIVVNKVNTDSLSFNYQFKLPDTLEVKAIPNGDGAIGVYSADPSLFGNITYSSDADRAAVDKAKATSEKNYLVFGLPKPVIKDTKGNDIGSARFQLNGNQLTVVAAGLSGVKGPVTIDPSVVVTSASDFSTGGNNEGMINFDAANNQITRGGLTGGSIGSWTSTTSLPAVVENASGTVYNGYIYKFGGSIRSPYSFSATVNYAAINSSNGTIGTWSTTTSLPAAEYHTQAVAYNGYMYILGGYDGSNALSTVYYATINSNGTLGTWQSGTSLPQGVAGGTAAVYQGYIYMFGGASINPPTCGSSSACLSTSYYVAMNADGSIGSWNTTTALNRAEAMARASAYNGYMYISGGGGSGVFSNVDYAQINADGTLGTWIAGPNLPSGRYAHAAYVYNGYLYVAGGFAGKIDSYYAQLNANGSIGNWTAETSLSVSLTYSTYSAYNGYLYIIGGYDGTNDHADAYSAKISAAGQTTAFAATTTSFTTARANICSVTYNGYIYAIGGSTTDSYTNNVTTVQYASLNSSTGQTGTWASTTVLPAAGGSMGCVAYNGYVYVAGGFNGSGTPVNIIMAAPINTNGTLGSWSGKTSTGLATGPVRLFVYNAGTNSYLYAAIITHNTNGTALYRSTITSIATATIGSWTAVSTWAPYIHNMAYAQVGSYIYSIGGSGDASYVNVYYAKIASDGSISAWTQTTSVNDPVFFASTTTVNGCIYNVGGENTTASIANVQYACPNADGTISAWYEAQPLSIATTDTAVTSYNGYIYAVGGYTTDVTTATLFAAVNNGGNGSLGSWTSFNTGNGLCSGRSGFRAVVYSGYIYTVGGGCGSTGNLVEYAALNADGSLGTFTSTSTLLEPNTTLTGVAVLNGYIYSFSGFNSSSEITTSEYAPINSNGSIGTWQYVTTSIPTARDTLGVAVYNGRIYTVSGDPGETAVEYAQPGTDGNISSWTTSANLPDNHWWSGVVAYRGYMYVLGGGIPYQAPTNEVLYAPINSDGTLGSWVATTPFNTPRLTTAVAANGFIYVVGGATTNGSAVSGAINTVQYAPIHGDGTLGSWQFTTSLAAGISTNEGSSIINNGYLYTLNDSGNIYYAPLNSIARTGYYSKLIDLGTSVLPTSITMTGGLANGLRDITYRAAGTNGIFGNATSASSGFANALNSCQADVARTRYVWISVKLNDSLGRVAGGAFSDANGTPSYLADLTINYKPARPTPDTRLRGGKTLQQGTLNQLDACVNQPIVAATGVGGSGTTTALAGVPNGVASGSLLVASVGVLWSEDTTTPTAAAVTAPAGWTQAGFIGYAYTGSSASFATALFYKYATAADSGTYTFAAGSVASTVPHQMAAVVQRISGGPTSGNPFIGTPMTQVGVSGGGTFSATGVTMPSFTATTNNSLLIGAAYCSWHLNWVAPSGWTLDGFATTNDVVSVSAYHQATQAGTVASTTFTQPGGGAAYLGMIGVIGPGY